MSTEVTYEETRVRKTKQKENNMQNKKKEYEQQQHTSTIRGRIIKPFQQPLCY